MNLNQALGKVLSSFLNVTTIHNKLLAEQKLQHLEFFFKSLFEDEIQFARRGVLIRTHSDQVAELRPRRPNPHQLQDLQGKPHSHREQAELAKKLSKSGRK